MADIRLKHKSMQTSRRDFIKLMTAVSLGFSGLKAFANKGSDSLLKNDFGYGPLKVFDPVFRLPDGFS